METTFRWGVMGTARIARKALIPAIVSAPGHQLCAVGSRHAANALTWVREVCREHDQPAEAVRCYGSYLELLADPDIDGVYIPLPNAMHAHWTIRALEAGKHVLCEKPLALNAAEVRTMAAAANAHQRVLMEAFMYRFHPRLEDLFAMVRSGAFGDLRMVQACFSFPLLDRQNIRFDPTLGGGALMDIGCYPLNLARTLLASEPQQVQAQATWTDQQVDSELFGSIRFANGAMAQIACSFNAARSEALTLVGSLGSVSLTGAFVPTGTQVELTCSYVDGRQETLRYPASDPYRRMIEHFAAVVHGHTPLRYNSHEALANMAVIEALYASARQAGVVTPVVAADPKPR